MLFGNSGSDAFVFRGVPTFEAFRSFIYESLFLPNVYLDSGFHQKLRQKKHVSVLLFRDSSEAGQEAEVMLRKLAKDLAAKAIFGISNVDKNYNPKLLSQARVHEESHLPVVRFVRDSWEENYNVAGLEGEITEENIKKSLEDFKEGKLRRLLRSEEISSEEYKDGYRIVVGKTWKDIVLDETKNRFVRFYCNKYQPIDYIRERDEYDSYLNPYNRYKNRKDMVFGVINICKNDVEDVNGPVFTRLYLKGSRDSFIHECQDSELDNCHDRYFTLLDNIYGGSYNDL